MVESELVIQFLWLLMGELSCRIMLGRFLKIQNNITDML